MWHGRPSPVEKRSQGRLRSTILKVRSDSAPIEKQAAEKVRPRALRGVFKNLHYSITWWGRWLKPLLLLSR